MIYEADVGLELVFFECSSLRRIILVEFCTDVPLWLVLQVVHLPLLLLMLTLTLLLLGAYPLRDHVEIKGVSRVAAVGADVFQ